MIVLALNRCNANCPMSWNDGYDSISIYLSMCYSDSVNLDNNAEAWCCYYNVCSKCSVWVVVGQGMKGGVKDVRVGRSGDVCGGGGGG